MFNNVFSWFKKTEEVDISFVDTTNIFYKRYPILSAKKGSLLKDIQIKEQGEHKFNLCPGLQEYSGMGYVLTSFADIYIKANKAGTFCHIGPPARPNGKPGDSETNYSMNSAIDALRAAMDDDTITPQISRAFKIEIQRMDTGIVQGIASTKDGIPPNVWKLDIPYKVVSKNEKLSMLLMPPYYQNPKLFENIYSYPGTVDFGKGFSVINFVFTIIKECEFVIPAGTPLLHMIPIIHSKDIKATYGASNFDLRNLTFFLKNSDNYSFYRRFKKFSKKYLISEHSNTEKIFLDSIKEDDNENNIR